MQIGKSGDSSIPIPEYYSVLVGGASATYLPNWVGSPRDDLVKEQQDDPTLQALYNQVLPDDEVESAAHGYFLQDGLLLWLCLIIEPTARSARWRCSPLGLGLNDRPPPTPEKERVQGFCYPFSVTCRVKVVAW
ncbi:unnamed protein product [Pleuronectes platessa]|uniref:Uncharacterized protein n=1 Tax=Pleuronectes platessa TaxID=8262 RepID=A0A9N7YYG2_PLEPL|nr:unnamed protein product [Pleuronectes platessa]